MGPGKERRGGGQFGEVLDFKKNLRFNFLKVDLEKGFWRWELKEFRIKESIQEILTESKYCVEIFAERFCLSDETVSLSEHFRTGCFTLVCQKMFVCFHRPHINHCSVVTDYVTFQL